MPSENVDARSFSRPNQADDVQHRVDSRHRETAQRRQAPQVVPSRQAAHERGSLDQCTDATSETLRFFNRLAEHGAGAARGGDQPEQNPDRGRLPRAIWTDEPDDTPSRNLERHIVHRHQVTESARQPVRGRARSSSTWPHSGHTDTFHRCLGHVPAGPIVQQGARKALVDGGGRGVGRFVYLCVRWLLAVCSCCFVSRRAVVLPEVDQPDRVHVLTGPAPQSQHLGVPSPPAFQRQRSLVKGNEEGMSRPRAGGRSTGSGHPSRSWTTRPLSGCSGRLLFG